MINLSGCIVLPPGVAKIFQIRKIQRLQLFPMTPYIVLVEIKVVRKYVINNFKLHDKYDITKMTITRKIKIMKFKVIDNVFSDNFYFDQNNVRCHWK